MDEFLDCQPDGMTAPGWDMFLTLGYNENRLAKLRNGFDGAPLAQRASKLETGVA
jgi:hypothetical protein